MHSNILHKIILFLGICLTTLGLQVSAQQEIAIGQWKSYLPYTKGLWVTQSESRIYYASEAGLVVLDKTDLAPEFFSRVEGLSDVGIRIVEYDTVTQSLIVVYENSNIDVITSAGIFNLNNILNDDQIVGDKRIHSVSFDKSGNGYLSTAFGLVQVDLNTMTFGFTLFADLDIYDMAFHEQFFYISTFDGLYKASANPQVNHSDFSAWTLVEGINGLPATFTSLAVESFKGALFFDVNGEVFKMEGDNANSVWSVFDYETKYLQSGNTHLIIGASCQQIDCTGDRVFFVDQNENVLQAPGVCSWRVVMTIQDEQGRIFYGDDSEGFRYAESVSSSCMKVEFNSPLGESASEIYIEDNVVYLASGGVNNALDYTFNADGLQIYDQGQWSAINRNTTPLLNNPVMYDFYRVLVHPFNDKIFVGTFWGGLIEIDGEEITVFNDQNSCIEKYPEEGLRERIGGMAFDSRNNLWLTSNRAPNPIVYFDGDGNCHNFSIGGERDLTQLVVDNRNQKWAVVYGNSAGLVVFDEEELEDEGDDRYKIINTANSALTTNGVNCIEKDLDGDIWVGTDEGVIVFECPGSILDNGCFGTRRKVDEGGNIAFLLEDEIVQTIAVDGANRKWFGTRNGIFVQSPTGEEKIAEYNTSNSPLPSNEIRDIAVNKETGEIFISTASGIVSYRTDATHGGLVHSSEVYAYPNPVRPGYDGPIAIKGLPRDAEVKITDIQGRLIYQVKANGGEAIWDGRDYNGRKAASGVYMVFSSSPATFDKPDAMVTKILIVN